MRSLRPWALEACLCGFHDSSTCEYRYKGASPRPCRGNPGVAWLTYFFVRRAQHGARAGNAVQSSGAQGGGVADPVRDAVGLPCAVEPHLAQRVVGGIGVPKVEFVRSYGNLKLVQRVPAVNPGFPRSAYSVAGSDLR